MPERATPWADLIRPSNFLPRDGTLDGRLKAGHGDKKKARSCDRAFSFRYAGNQRE
jgi:hypothetical protein